MSNKRKLAFILLFAIVCFFILLTTSCRGDQISTTKLVGMYVSYSDLKPIIAQSITDPEFKDNLYKYPKKMYMNGYNFTFLYVKNNGEFYHHFSDKNKLIQKTTGKVSSKSDDRFELKGETIIIDEEGTKKEPFKAILSNNSENRENVTDLKLDYLDIRTPEKRVYATSGYKKMSDIDDLMCLGFESIRNYNRNILRGDISEKFPEVKDIFAQAQDNIDTWMSLDIENGFYGPTSKSEKSFIYIDEEDGSFLYLTLDSPLYGGMYAFEGRHSLEGNLIVTDGNKQFLPFLIVPDEKRERTIGLKSVENIVYMKYDGDNYLETLDDDFILEIKSDPFVSPTLSKIVKNADIYKDKYDKGSKDDDN